MKCLHKKVAWLDETNIKLYLPFQYFLENFFIQLYYFLYNTEGIKTFFFYYVLHIVVREIIFLFRLVNLPIYLL